MSETPEPQDEFKSGDLASEFQELGSNLKKIFLNAWESEERKNFQVELEEGLTDLGDSLKQTAQEIHDSETGQRVKAEAEDLRDRVRSGEVEEKIREDLLTALHKVNTELKKVSQPEPPSSETIDEDPGNG
jgi:hypothetical protein